MNVIVWVSAGAASAVAAKLTVASHPEARLVYVNPGSEHDDNERFLGDCERWFGKEIERHRSEKYADTWDVWNTTGYLVGPSGARCTGELKKKVRFKIEQPDDVQVFGYTIDEQHRADRFEEQNPGIIISTPLIEQGLSKSDCLSLIERAGIQIPMMYQLGYNNNNCIGCVKGGMGYWNKIRQDFPDVFQRMAELEQKLGRTVLRDKGEPLPLFELDPNRGNHDDEPSLDCSLNCILAEAAFETER